MTETPNKCETEAKADNSYGGQCHLVDKNNRTVTKHHLSVDKINKIYQIFFIPWRRCGNFHCPIKITHKSYFLR